jgi:hypothetical protein
MMIGKDQDNTRIPTRFVAAAMVSTFADFLKNVVLLKGLSIEDLAIIIVVAAESTKALTSDRNTRNIYGFEHDVIPNSERHPLPLKTIYTSLGLNRETARRKVNGLVERGYLMKVGRGYIFPQQTGQSDYTADLRRIVSLRVINLLKLLQSSELQ